MLLAVIMVPIAVVVLVLVFVLTGSDEQPVAERRPPPGNGLTNDVGDYNVGQSEPVSITVCPAMTGVRVAGSEQDRARLSQGLDALCDADLPEAAQEALSPFVAAGGVVRFAQFQATGVDSTASTDPLRILINNKFTGIAPKWIAPVVAHDLVLLNNDAGTAETALLARQVENAICHQIVEQDEQASRGCVDAAELLALDDPIAALHEAGYR